VRSPSSLAAEDPEYRRNRTILLINNPHCYWCGQLATTADHLQPVARGGGNERENLVPACARCNYSRQAKGGRFNHDESLLRSPPGGSWRAPTQPFVDPNAIRGS
jgi:5-methylcytosine-specific restriction endonuclease McrA